MMTIHNPHLEGDSFFWQDGPIGVLLIHGYTATTAEVRLLAHNLHIQGYTVAGPLLPGHKTTPEDMNRYRWQDWTGAVEQTYQSLAACCDHVFVGGESMGALLALYAADQHPEATGLLIYAPALRVPLKSVILAHLFAPFKSYVKKDTRNISDKWQGYPAHPLQSFLQMYRLQKEVRRRLPHIQHPLLLVQGQLDTTIDMRGVDELYHKIGSSFKALHWMENSTHVVILDQELEQVTALTVQFIERILEKIRV